MATIIIKSSLLPCKQLECQLEGVSAQNVLAVQPGLHSHISGKRCTITVVEKGYIPVIEVRVGLLVG